MQIYHLQDGGDGTNPTVLSPEITTLTSLSASSQLNIGELVVSVRYNSQALYKLRIKLISGATQKTYTSIAVRLTAMYIYNDIQLVEI